MKQSEIAQLIRDQIVSSSLAPGARLPTRLELEQRFGSSSVTIQRALDQLSAEGFVEAHGRRGTFVSDAPPHLHRYGLVFASRPAAGGAWNRWWQTLVHVAQDLQARSGKQIKLFYDVDPRLSGSAEYQALEEAVTSQTVAGLIFACHPYIFVNTPVLDFPGVPRMAFTGEPFRSDMAAFQFNNQAYQDKAFDYFLRRGRKRLAVLGQPMSDRLDLAWTVAAQKRGLETRPAWTLAVPLNDAHWAQNVVMLLMSLPPSERPDALLIKDDNLTEQALYGLRDSGVRVGEDLDVIAHANFPVQAPLLLPAKRLGWDSREILRLGMAYIDAHRRKESAPDRYLLDAWFEEELAEPLFTSPPWPAVRVHA